MRYRRHTSALLKSNWHLRYSTSPFRYYNGYVFWLFPWSCALLLTFYARWYASGIHLYVLVCSISSNTANQQCDVVWIPHLRILEIHSLQSLQWWQTDSSKTLPKLIDVQPCPWLCAMRWIFPNDKPGDITPQLRRRYWNTELLNYSTPCVNRHGPNYKAYNCR